MLVNTEKYDFENYFESAKDNNGRVCLITEIREVERANSTILNRFIKAFNPIKIFALSNDVVTYVSDEKCCFYKNDNRGNSGFINDIISYLCNISTILDTIIVDTSAINKETLLEILYVLRNIIHVKATIKLTYITPLTYGDYAYNNYKLPYSLSFSPGIQFMGKKTALILLSGYEEYGELALIRYIDPKYLFIGLAEPSTEEHFKKQNQENINKIIKEFSKDEGIKILDFNCSGNDINQCVDNLNDLINNNKLLENFNVFVAPMNNKLTTISSYLVWEMHTEIQLINIRGEKMTDSINESGVNHIYIFEIKE